MGLINNNKPMDIYMSNNIFEKGDILNKTLRVIAVPRFHQWYFKLLNKLTFGKFFRGVNYYTVIEIKTS